ncbi:MAG: ABC transporter ATP-binding protein/permease [Oscillospiraceae bacterium]|nr:ABC transporter ATP-binding protein/permease [Oscillospiraceae bacterium]
MKQLWRVAKEAKKYKWLLLLGMLSTLVLIFLNLAAPMFLARITGIVEQGVTSSGMYDILRLTLIILILYIVRVVFRFLSSYIPHKAAWNLVKDMRMRVYNHIQGFSMSFFHDKQTGDLMSRVVNDTATFELLYAHIMPETVTNMVTLTGVTIILFSMNAKLALMTCIPIPLILAAAWFLMKKVRGNFRKMQENLAELNSQLQDNLSGIQEIQAFCQHEKESDRVNKRAESFTVHMLKALKLSAIFHPSVEWLTSMGTVIVVGYGGFLAYTEGLSAESIVAFLLYLALFYAPITGLSQLLENAQHAFAGIERVLQILDVHSEVKNKPDARELPDIEGKIEFKNVSFSYTDDVRVLDDVSFEVLPGQMVALVGPTGVGKTTLTQLAARFYDPTEGSIFIDGHDLRDVTQNSLRSQISIVLQDTFLFNGTIEENIAYAKPGASPEQIEHSARSAGIYEDILEMPKGFQTEIGERGVKLSGGQKQRLAIARAIIRNAPVLILDEATASVDTQTEAKIQTAIQNLSGSRTVIAIAHRLSTIKHADVILVLDEGRVVQRGSHDELVKQDGMYKKLWAQISV